MTIEEEIQAMKEDLLELKIRRAVLEQQIHLWRAMSQELDALSRKAWEHAQEVVNVLA